MDVEAPQLQT